ncbi:hypothetical protein [Micromonospora sp. CB01531]|uniref:hypothetical protein n=1 Tax=Micromonospora sp. CB01531 TaxID=1718947 RepID=UPI00093B5031|nr:hypothetical protein [Micromonospora sp. CB01531]OKI46767.1 hypothetical protein A6A27_36895 [Micromonospora sp. CB01531]
MADTRELMVAIDLRDDLSDDEVSELRWHLGLAPQPRELPIWSTLSPVARAMYEDEDGNLVVDDEPHPILDGRGAGHHIPGTLFSELVRRDGAGQVGWALAVRQEMHPDDEWDIEALLLWLVAHADLPCGACTAGNCPAGCEFFAGYRRFYEDPRLESHLVIKGGEVGWSERTGTFVPVDGGDQI